MVTSSPPSSPSVDEREDQLVRASSAVWTRLQDVRNRLRSEKSKNGGQLKPSDVVNRAFTELVNLCVHTTSPVEDCLLASFGGSADFDKMVLELRQYATEGEAHLEKYWARKLITENRSGHAKGGRLLGGLVRNPFYRPRYPLEKFTYYDNYVHLTRLELAALRSVMPSGGLRPTPCTCSTATTKPAGLRLAFVGSGPMPLSSVELGNQAPDVTHIHNIDSDDEAVRLSVELSKIFSFGIRTGTKYTFECSDIRDVVSLRDYDVVFVASLVGTCDAEKADIFRHLNRIMRPGAHLVVRSIRGLRELLYPKVTMAQVRSAGFAELLQTNPYGGHGVVNSVLVAVKVATTDEKMSLG